MTLRANVTTTYRETNATQPRAVNRQKRSADQEVHESDSTRTPAKPATKVSDQGVIPTAEQEGNRSVARNRDRIASATDSFEPGSAKAAATSTEASAPPGSGSGQHSNADEGKVTGATYGPEVGRSVAAEYSRKASASPKRLPESREHVRNQRTSSNETASSRPGNRFEKDESPSQSLPVAIPPKIRQTEQVGKTAAVSQDAASATPDEEIANGWNTEAMQHELMTALQFAQPPEKGGESNTSAGGEVAKHLQAEGVFGISAVGRNLGATDFIRQKQFEYRMDQRQFTADDLLLETEKAIQGTLNSDQSSAVSKSLLQAAESINAYRNESLRTSEYAEMSAESSRASDQISRTPLKKPG